MADANWYVVHTYSGYENKVKANIDKTIENRHLEDQILEVRVPMLDVAEVCGQKYTRRDRLCRAGLQADSAHRHRDEKPGH